MGHRTDTVRSLWTSPQGYIRFLTLLLLSGAGATPGAAQLGFDKPPDRPRLAADRDTNSAVEYYYFGNSELARDPYKAAAAYYWASRLDPSWAAPVYGQYAALLLNLLPGDLTLYLTRRERALRDPKMRRIDSLGYLAVLKNPLVDRRLDGVILTTWVYRMTGGQAELRDLGKYDRQFTAWAAYARGDFPMAVSVYAEVIKKHPRDADLLFSRALAFVGLAQIDSARASIRAALALERVAEEESPYGWVSHAFAEYSIGHLFNLEQQPDSARAAYERALLDDVSFHPAHMQLARARLIAHDTAGALAEYGHAAALAPNDAEYLYEFGTLLAGAGHADSATTVLLQAVAADPYYPSPHFPLGLLYQQSGFAREAADHFEAFLRLAPRSLAGAIAAAQKRLAALKAMPPAP